MNKSFLMLAIGASIAAVASGAAAPKRLLVVTTSVGFRHSSIELTEKVIRDLAKKSGDFTVISTIDHPEYPDLTGSGAFGTQVADGTPAQMTYIRKLNDRFHSPLVPLQAKLTEARTALATAAISGDRAAITARTNDLGAAELALARAKADAFATLQSSDNRLTARQVEVLQGRGEQAAAPMTAFVPQVGTATPRQQKAIVAANTEPMLALVTAASTARQNLTLASVTGDAAAVRSAADALATAERNLANARAEELARIQTTAGKLDPKVVKTMVSRLGRTTNDAVANVLGDMLSVEALKNYDGVFFISTVGALPFPDLDGFIKWVNDGGAWMGNHGSSDSMHGVTKFYDMMGGEFTQHGSQTRELMTVTDPDHPIGKALGAKTITIYDEMYTFENANFDYSKVRSILDFTVALNDGRHFPVGAPGMWPSTWVKNVGRGRVFYTALGHREDVVDPDWNPAARMNPPEVARAFQSMLHTGIRWGLGIIPGDATPQIKVPTPAGGPGVTRAAPAP